MVTPNGIKPDRTGFMGLIDKLLARNLETLLTIPGGKRFRIFEKSTLDVEETQNQVLKELIKYARNTVFGKEHHFKDIKSYEDYKANVPMGDYEDHRPYIKRHQKGETNVLFPGKPLMYNCSSGTTAEPKLLPVTPYNFERSIKDRSKLWLYGIQRHFPGIYEGKCLGVVSTHEEGRTEDGTPYGSISGLVRKNVPSFLNLTHTAPYAAMLISNHRAKTYTMCRFALACSDVTLIITANPATVLNLAVKADLWKDEIIRDIREGTIKADLEIEPEIREELESKLEPAPERAAVLEALAKQHDRLRPAEYWPDLKLLHMWTNGNTGLMVPKLRTWFREETPALDFGYLASEILAADIMVPGNGGSVLAVQTGFYEFVPVEEEDAEDRTYLMAHQLKKGGKYFIYISTFSGLYRYDMNDVIEVIDFYNTAPVIKFLYKGKGITNMQGEKLSEAQFLEAMGRAKKRTGIKHDFYIGYADVDESRYNLYIEFMETYTDEQKRAFGEAVDKALCEVNVEYETKFKSERIHPLQVIDMGKDLFSRYRRIRLEEGAYDGQIKWLQLSSTAADKHRLELLRSDESMTSMAPGAEKTEASLIYPEN